MNVEKIISTNCELEDLNTCCNYLFTFIIEKLMIPGLVETWIMVVDLNNVSLTSIPMSKVKAIIANG